MAGREAWLCPACAKPVINVGGAAERGGGRQGAVEGGTVGESLEKLASGE